MSKPNQQTSPFFPPKNPDDLSSHRHRQLVGITGMLLPLLVWLFAGLRPTPELLPAWSPLGSVSAYYYSEAIPIFSGGLIALAIFLFSYGGYANEHGHYDRLAAVVAGIAAILVTIFPTEAPLEALEPSWWRPFMNWLHFGGAVALFGSFIFFAYFQFPRTQQNGEPPSASKRGRNLFYRLCAVGMVLCMIWAVVAFWNKQPIFWPETIALEIFAISWLVKGQAHYTAIAIARQAMHPQELLQKAQKALSSGKAKNPPLGETKSP